jgi:hypothetical protein
MAPPQFFVAGRKLLVDGRAAIDGIRVDLDFSAGSVSGRAIVAAGNPIPDARVVLQSVDSQKLGVDADSKVSVPQPEYTRSPASRQESISCSRGEAILL